MKRLTIGQLAMSAGVNIQTVRYYERLRLLAAEGRLPSGYRVYTQLSVRRLGFIKRAQGLGFTLKEIQGLLNLRVRTTARCADVRRSAQEKLKEVKSKVEDLKALARSLGRLIETCRSDQSTDRCSILKSLERDTIR
ncbi:MAG: heavy metal-responsive transcriptional regulator [Nitrospirales bacterium]